MPRLILKVTLRDLNPPIWRRVDVPSSISLAQLHRVLQVAMGWEDAHLHQFEQGRDVYGTADREFGVYRISEASTRVGDVLVGVGSRLTYLYDFGDSWTHLVVVEQVTEDEGDEVRPAVVLAGRRACPPEDCGGSWGYDTLVAAVRDPAHPEHAAFMQWLRRPWDPEAFDVAAVNRRLARLKLRPVAPTRRRRPAALGPDGLPDLDHKVLDFFKRKGRA